MRYPQTYLMTAGELQMAAAASGRKSLLMFKAEEKPGRAQQLQAVFHMVNEGLLVHESGGLRAGAPLLPLLEVLRRADCAVTVQAPGCGAAPVCIYPGGQRFLCAAPHRHSAGLYEVSLFALDALLDDLEARGLLPAMDKPSDLGTEEFSSGIREKLETLDEPWSGQTVCDTFGDDLLSYFERYRLSDQAAVDQLLIVKAPFTWCAAARSQRAQGPAAYSRGALSAWLKGASQ